MFDFDLSTGKLQTIIANQRVMTAKLDLLLRHQGVDETLIRAVLAEEKHMAETVTDIVAKIEAQTTILQSIDTAANQLAAGNATIADEIAALKAQIEAGTTPDFSAVDAALSTQDGVIAQIATAIPANTPTP